ncbi:MAG: recombination mediator RecR [Planctomycetota bacterium]
MSYPAPVEGLIEAFERFPGIGRRSAERLALHVLRDPRAADLGRAIERALQDTQRCQSCCNVAESDPCAICSDPEREAQVLCVVEEPRHVEALERAGVFRGRYHVLMGAFQPAEGTEARQWTIGALVERIREGEIREVILGLDPDAEGDATALLVLEALETLGDQAPRVTRLARGLPAGSGIEYLHKGVLEEALEERRAVRRRG